MILYSTMRSAHKKLKEGKRKREGAVMSRVRRIEQVALREKVCAMTFDDGPFALTPNPDVTDSKSLTMHLCDVLASYNCTATFDIVGDTSQNYPDQRGKLGTPYWGGQKFDHYPDIDMDRFGGAYHCQDIISHLLKNNMELANHGYRHIICGPMKAVYGLREHFHTLDQVISDLDRLHNFIKKEFNYEMTLSRPPHYIDNIPDGLSVYDAYTQMNYNYLAASFDGGGWLPSNEGYDTEVEAMIETIKRTLDDDEYNLCGQIIFQKDGCNMNKRTPVASALDEQLKLLKDYGYRVVSVGELLRMSMFTDIFPDDECYPAVTKLAELGYPVSYRNNTFCPYKPITFGELCYLLCPKEKILERLELHKKGVSTIGKLPVLHPYSTAIEDMRALGIEQEISAPVDSAMLSKVLKAKGLKPKIEVDGKLTRQDTINSLAGCLSR